MYKVPEYILKEIKESLDKTAYFLKLSNSGVKLHPDEVKSILEESKRLSKLLEDNYYV